MACRDRSSKGKIDEYEYCILEVQLTKVGGEPGTERQLRLVTVDNQVDTLRFVQENLDACIGNIVRLQRLDERCRPLPGRA
jgi:hypothetical protein